MLKGGKNFSIMSTIKGLAKNKRYLMNVIAFSITFGTALAQASTTAAILNNA
eukprot:CAMPEP_0176474150 /NCGR_PEP_ID=MMETSP0127-20121128/42803_1 /TAXON_ID=938130 /ORGANISM="Platyophrya macrostoma, Strain WH" /LENGTH=51 /DNA_ID=CAMNT_0017869427 /DNA_START=1 /DNA_END=152 /DNA_ORIENTATION=+